MAWAIAKTRTRHICIGKILLRIPIPNRKRAIAKRSSQKDIRLGTCFSTTRRDCSETGKSAEGISYIGNLDILTALIIAAQLKDQCPYMVAQLSL